MKSESYDGLPAHSVTFHTPPPHLAEASGDAFELPRIIIRRLAPGEALSGTTLLLGGEVSYHLEDVLLWLQGDTEGKIKTLQSKLCLITLVM